MLYDASGVGELMTWEELRARQLVILPRKREEAILAVPPGLRVFHDAPEAYRLTTPTGLLEYSSTNIEKYLPDDPERPPVAHWIEKGVSHDERLGGERAARYPLLMVSNHGCWRMHASATT